MKQTEKGNKESEPFGNARSPLLEQLLDRKYSGWRTVKKKRPRQSPLRDVTGQEVRNHENRPKQMTK